MLTISPEKPDETMKTVDIEKLNFKILSDVVAGKTGQKALPYMSMLISTWDAGYDAILRDAPALVVAYAPKEVKNNIVDLSIALSYLDLMAPSMRMGTCWAGLFQGAILASPDVKKELGLPLECSEHYPTMVGYPRFRYQRQHERKEPVITWA